MQATAAKYSLEEVVEIVRTMLKTGAIQEAEAFDDLVPTSTVKEFKKSENYPDIMKAKDVQNFLRISEKTTYELLNHPKCPIIRFGTAIRIRKDQLLEFLDARERNFEGVQS